MKLQIISPDEMTLKDRCGFVFCGLASEIPQVLAELDERCPRCGGILTFRYSMGENRVETADAEYCGACGHYEDYEKEEK